MKKQDLRIGNWYTSVKFKIPVTCDLSDLYDLCANSDGATDHPPIDEMFEPIPLTEKWLLKFGFSKCASTSGGDEHTIDYTSGFAYINAFDGMISFRGKGWANWDDIKYVHELQNLHYAITKEELVLAVAP